ncbi:hypothetical protein N2152v2_003583 [Parachlorella kessleri]
MSLQQPPIIVPAAQEPQSSALIMLHGRGDSAAGWAHLAALLSPGLPHSTFVFPNAPMRSITKLGGALMPAWFDNPPTQLVLPGQVVVPDGILDSRRYIEELLQHLAREGIPSSRVVVAGFSQGASMALLMLRSERQLAGVAALSGYLPMQHEPVLSGANKSTPVLLCHGTADRMNPYELAQQAAARLEAAGGVLQFKTYVGLGHSACEEEMDDLRQFLAACLVQHNARGAQPAG